GIERMVFMGGAAQAGNATASAEFNVFHDPEAAAIALDACVDLGVEVVMYGLDVFYGPQVALDVAADLAAMHDSGPAGLAGRVVVLGSLNVDRVTRVERHPSPGETVLGEGLSRLAGGKGANQASAAARAGASVVMVGAVGDDEGGSAYRARLSSLGIDVSRL